MKRLTGDTPAPADRAGGTVGCDTQNHILISASAETNFAAGESGWFPLYHPRPLPVDLGRNEQCVEFRHQLIRLLEQAGHRATAVFSTRRQGPVSVSGAAPRVRPNHSGAEIGGPESKIGASGRARALQRLDDQARQFERKAAGPTVQELIGQEQRFPSYGGGSGFGWEHGQSSGRIERIGDR